MANKTELYHVKATKPLLFPGLLFLALALISSSCQETYPPLAVTEAVTIPYAIVSVTQPKDATEASIEIKIPNADTENFQIEFLAKNGSAIPLRAGADIVVANFKLRPYIVQSLVADEIYTARLTYHDAQNNEIKVERNFKARVPGGWKKLPHAPIFGGDYTGAAVLSPLFQSRIGVYQYYDASTWNILRYSGKWENIEAGNPQPRHGAIAFQLAYFGSSEQVFMGFGYLVNEKAPGKRAYLSDFWSVGNHFSLGQTSFQVFHQFPVNALIKYFTASEEVYLLRENDETGAMYAMNFKWDQRNEQPFPEKTEGLATFTIDSTGYVVNQVVGQAAHLYAFDPVRKVWERKADFPGERRGEGTGFSTKGKGYFGLGLNEKGEGLRDVWEYDPTQNHWKYHSEYPGQGHRLLIALSDKNKAYLGWGYENRPVVGTLAKQQVGCTDFWEFSN